MSTAKKLKERKALRDYVIKTYNPKPEDLENMVTICPTYHVSFYLANAMIYFSSHKRKKESIGDIKRSITYLEKLNNHKPREVLRVWDKADASMIGKEFKGLADIVKYEHAPEDIEKALMCLRALRFIIMSLGDDIQRDKIVCQPAIEFPEDTNHPSTDKGRN